MLLSQASTTSDPFRIAALLGTVWLRVWVRMAITRTNLADDMFVKEDAHPTTTEDVFFRKGLSSPLFHDFHYSSLFFFFLTFSRLRWGPRILLFFACDKGRQKGF